MTASRARTYRIPQMHEVGLGGHLCARLEPFELTGYNGLTRVRLWGTGGNKNVNAGEAGLQRALLLPSNRHLLARMAGLEEAPRPEDTPEPLFAAREVCDVDVLAVFDGAPRRLLLVDCKAAGAGQSPADQLVQALRNALVARGNVLVGSCETRLVLLRGWRPGAKPPPLPSQLPVWCDDRDWLRREHVSFWGFHPFRMPTGVDATFLDTWEVLDADPRIAATKKSDANVYSPKRKLSPESKLEQELEPRMRIYLRLLAAEHRTALRDEDSALGRLRLATHRGESPLGWRFAGELNDKGCVRLVWEPETSTGADASTLEAWVNAYLQVHGT